MTLTAGTEDALFFLLLFFFLSFTEIDRVQKGETEKDAETYLDIFTAKNIKLKERVLIPVKQYPKVSEGQIRNLLSVHHEITTFTALLPSSNTTS